MPDQSTISIQFNGETRQVSAGMSISDLLASADIRHKLVAVEINQQIVPREQHQSHRLVDGDVVEAVTLVGGG